LQNDEIIILASDGLWCVISSEKAIEIAANTIFQEGTPVDEQEETFRCIQAARSLEEEARLLGSNDNLSVIVLLCSNRNQSPLVQQRDLAAAPLINAATQSSEAVEQPDEDTDAQPNPKRHRP